MKLFLNTSDRYKKIVTLDGKDFQSSGDTLELIDGALKDRKVKLNDVGQFEAFSGPGSFTGIRLGCAIINAINYGLGRVTKYNQLVLPDYGREPNISKMKKEVNSYE